MAKAIICPCPLFSIHFQYCDVLVCAILYHHKKDHRRIVSSVEYCISIFIILKLRDSFGFLIKSKRVIFFDCHIHCNARF